MRRGVHQAFALSHPSQVGDVRRAAADAARALGFDEVTAGRASLIATELGNNLVRHARDGALWLAAVDGPQGQPQLELISVDRGPGIADVAACMADGYSTAGTPGTGLGAVRRMADLFDIYSATPGGTLILARVADGAAKGAPAQDAVRSYVVGAVALPAPGEHACGDAWLLADREGRCALMVADGLGHGPLAADAALAAAQCFDEAPFLEPARVVQRLHDALRKTRGAAVAVATPSHDGSALSYCGAGNIAGRMISGVADFSLMSQHGTAGVQIRSPREQRYDWPPHGLLVLHSDGIASRWSLPDGALLRHHPSLIAAWVMLEHRRGSDDATIVVLKGRGATA